MNRPVSDRVRQMISELPEVCPAPGPFQPATTVARHSAVADAGGVGAQAISPADTITPAEMADAKARVWRRLLHTVARLVETTPPPKSDSGCATATTARRRRRNGSLPGRRRWRPHPPYP